MSDIKCVVCGEPWDAYGVTHGDMLPWESELFKQGAGCPSCEGTPNGWTPASIFDLANGDDDEMLRCIAAERVADGTSPKWEKPADPVHWTCNNCGVNVVTDIDTGELEYYPFRNGTPEDKPAHTFGESADSVKVCEFCLETCTECDAPLCGSLSGDTYDGLASFPSPGDPYHSVVCVDCLSKVEEDEAQRVWLDCYSDAERITYMRKHPSQFDCLFIADKANDRSLARRWRDILANARGRYFGGYASEILS